MIELVKLYTTFCVPCKMLTPILEQLKQEYSFKLEEVCLDEGIPEKFQALNIMSTPTILFYKDGKLRETMTGLRSKDAIAEVLKRLSKC